MKALAIAARELRSLFVSPLAWSVLAVLQMILAYLFLLYLDQFSQLQPRLAGLPEGPGVTEMVVVPLIQTAGFVLLLIVPLITMRVFSEERKNGTLGLLFCAPVSMAEIVAGKFLGVMAFLAAALGLIALMPLSLLMGGDLDVGLFLSGMLGLLLTGSSFAAAGLFVSSLTAQPTIAAAGSFGLLMLLWILDLAGGSGAGNPGELFAYLSFLPHFEALLKGIFDTRDISYYLLFIVTFLALSVRRLHAERLQH